MTNTEEESLVDRLRLQAQIFVSGEGDYAMAELLREAAEEIEYFRGLVEGL